MAGTAGAQDGSNEVCPAQPAEADDVRSRYDANGHLVHELRLRGGRVVQETAISWRGDHAVARTEVTPGGRRIARTYFDGDEVVVAECYERDRRVGYARYSYDDAGRVVLVDRRTLVREASAAGTPGSERWVQETTRNSYDENGQLVRSEVRDGAGKLKSRTENERARLSVPVVLALTAGGSYQSDTELYDFLGAIGIHRDPGVEHYASDPLEVGLDATYRFNRASGITTTDQTTVRLTVDYHDILPRTTLFTFATTERNLPANLNLNLEVAVVGVKFDVIRPRKLELDVSFAPVWNFRSISSPEASDANSEETTSKLRGSLRARGGLRFETWSLLDTFEFSPTLLGDDAATEDDFWHRTVVRNTVSFDLSVSERLTFRQIFKYTWDSAMRAQATCPDDDNPLCLGYSFSSTTALSLKLDL